VVHQNLSFTEERIVWMRSFQKIIEVKDEVMEKMKENKEMIFNANNRRDFNTATGHEVFYLC